MIDCAASAIVVSYRTGPRLRDCLYALKSDPEIDEIILIDNGNRDIETEWLRSDVAQWEKVAAIIEPGENLGFGRACNAGTKAAQGELLVFINPDAMVRRGSVSAFRKAMEDLGSPSLIGGKIFGIDGKEQRGGRRRDLTWMTASGLQRWNLENDPPPDGAVPMPVVSGAFFAIRKADFESVGGFDEAYFLHVEDVDLCRKVRAAGGKVIYQPEAGALHYGATSDAPSAVVAAHKADSLALYFRKWARSPLDHALNALLLPLLRWQVKRNSR